MFPEELRVGSFPDRFPHSAWTAWSTHSYFVGSRVYICVRVTCYLHFRQNDRGFFVVFFTCHCGSTGMERTPNEIQHTKSTLEKKILPPLLPGFELATFRSRVLCSTNKLSLSVVYCCSHVLFKKKRFGGEMFHRSDTLTVDPSYCGESRPSQWLWQTVKLMISYFGERLRLLRWLWHTVYIIYCDEKWRRLRQL